MLLGDLPGSFRTALRAEFWRATKPPYELPIVVLVNGLLVVLFWFSRFKDTMFTLHGTLAFPIVLGSWMYSDVPATNVLASDSSRVLAALDDIPMLMRLMAARAALLWLLIVPECVIIAVAIGFSDGRAISALWTVIAIAIVPLGALAISDWVGILWPYHPISLKVRWRERRKVWTQIRWIILICAPYLVVPAALAVVALPAYAWWHHKTAGVVERISDGLFGQLVAIASVTSIVVWFAARAVSRYLLRRRRDELRTYLSATETPNQVAAA
jgi:hypothetical protein